MEEAKRRLADRQINLISLQDMISVDPGGFSYGCLLYTSGWRLSPQFSHLTCNPAYTPFTPNKSG